MAWSRTGSVSGAGGQGSITTTDQTSNTTGSSSTSQSSQQTQNSAAQNMSDSSLAALEALIVQLMGGGTQEMVNQNAQRNAEIAANRNLRAGYGKSDAFTDAQGAMAQQQRRVLESMLPSIVRAAEGAGTSQNAMRALMLQDAANRAAESSSALGLDAATKYGQVAAGFSGILEALTRPNDPASQALLQALGVAKGAVTSGTVNTTGSSTSNTNTNQQTNQQTQQVQQPYSAGGTIAGGVGAGDGGLVAYGPTFDPLSLNSTAWSNLMSQYGAQSGGDLASMLDTGNLSNRITF